MIKPSGRVVYKLLLTARHQSRPLLAACSTNHIQAFNARYSSGDVESRKHELSEKKLTKRFVDWRRVRVKAGDGGNGSISLRRAAFEEFGGPDGGDGGNGGHILLQADRRTKSLGAVKPHYKAEHGHPGAKNNSSGKNGAHTIVKVPVGTVVKDDKVTVVDLESEGDQFVLARGGQGGRGNKSFATPSNRTPRIAGRGTPGEESLVSLELKIMAHAGLIGFPNAGKSTLLRALSRARPAVAAYPFTTLNPHVGMVEYDDLEQVAVADLPGLIRGAHLNRGLGHSFLRHIERCSCLLYVLDLSAKEPWTQLYDLQYELEQYKEGLSQRPHAILANKIDLPEAEEKLALLRENVQLPIIVISAHYLTNIAHLKVHLRELYDEDMKGRLKPVVKQGKRIL
ncbi:mitochondrial ribosome-associated GTPase 2-like [Asterias rubens]|uniref:mitochondrial ribosome-associated GTPase 2-like n=1 Tax=Asterias rubens TaxID=7604 RepID=UPI001454E5FF|nr:mitochondrial ribosome-associated GTPase 2-like [Asterias rubens]XP_033625734.1 mitochondrial ribosome-associated GTPase 2-like [Asterias rubens]XP_033625735.1 mitochondrial ribosome-associated GTPase 2-like [Asterias rubens]